MSANCKYINIGIVAHVDAGKTSITEQILFKSGVTRSLGSVDKGTSQTDWLSVERDRGISVRSASASCEWKNININIIDTPGHVDFSAEVERSILAMDCAVIVVSAVEGIQAHTETLWNALRKINIPAIIFINKIDRIGAVSDTIIADIKNELTSNIVTLQSVIDEETNNADVVSLLTADSGKKIDEEIIETIVSNNDQLFERYLNNDDIKPEELIKSLIVQVHNKELFPVLFGSAKFDVGINELLDTITEYMPVANGEVTKPLSGIAYKIEHDNTIGRIASIRLFNGHLINRDSVYNVTQNKEEKVSQIRKLQGQKYIDIGELSAGDTAAVCGFSSIKAGDIIGSQEGISDKISLNTALLTVKITGETNDDFSELARAMNILTDEDPTIDLVWLKDERELHIKIMGLIQLEILEAVLLDRFNLKVSFGDPTVIYRETLKSAGEGYEEYTMPKPCWAVVRFKLEPGEPGSGVEYKSEVGVNDIAHRYQQEIERTIPKALQQGILGWEVTDIKITLVGGEHHNIHSRAGDFAIATPMALMNGFKSTGTQLLEPMLDYTINAPEMFLGKVISSLTLLRAEIGNPQVINDNFTLTGTIPVSTSLDYPAKISSVTGGKGKYSARFSGYRECSLELGTITPFRGISPLDRAKYILKARKALQ